MLIRDGNNLVKYIRTTGNGDTEQTPYIMSNDTFIQDQASPPVIIPLAQELGVSFLTSDAVINTRTISVISSTLASVGDHIREHLIEVRVLYILQ